MVSPTAVPWSMLLCRHSRVFLERLAQRCDEEEKRLLCGHLPGGQRADVLNQSHLLVEAALPQEVPVV